MLIYDSLWIGGFFFVSFYLEGKVLKVDLSGKVISKYESFKNPLALAKHADKVYLLDVGTLKLYRYNEDEDEWILEEFPYDVSHPYWIEFNGQGLVVVDKDKRALLNFDEGNKTPSLFLSSPIYLFDMPCSIKFSSKKAYLLANGERTLIEFSLNGEPLNLWELLSSPVCWTIFKDSPYLLCNGYLLTLKGGKLLKKVIDPRFKAILSSDSLFLWDGISSEEVKEDGLEEVDVKIKPGRVVGITADIRRARDDFKALTNYLVERGKSLNLSFGEVLREAVSNLSLDTLLKLHSKVLLMELDFKRTYPNVVKFLSSLPVDFIRGIFPQLKELLKLFTFTDKLWFLPWEVYWKIPYAYRKDFKKELYEVLSEDSLDVKEALEILSLTLPKISGCLEDFLNQSSKDKVLRDFNLLNWIVRVATRALFLYANESEIKSCIETFVSWRGEIDLVKLSERLEYRRLLSETLNLWDLNSFYLALAEEYKGVLGNTIFKDEAEKIEGIFYATYALEGDEALFISDWGEGSLYKLSLEGKLLWRKDDFVGASFILLKDNELYVSMGLNNAISIVDSESGEVKGKIFLPDGSKAGKLFESRCGDVFCSYYLKGRVFLRNLSINQDVFYSGSDFTYLTPDDVFVLSFPGSIHSYVSSGNIKAMFDSRLLSLRDWYYKDGMYIGNALWPGNIVAFRLDGDKVESVEMLAINQFSSGIPVSIKNGVAWVFYSLGYLKKIPLGISFIKATIR